MFESSQKTSVVNRLTPVCLFFILISYELSETYLLSFSFEIALFPLSSPLMSCCFVDTLAMHLVIIKLSLISTTIHILHCSFACFFALNKLALIDHTFEDFLLAKTMRFGVMPFSIIWKYFAYEISTILDESALTFKFTTLAIALIKRSICIDKDGWTVFSLAIDNFTIVDVIVCEDDKYGSIHWIRNLTVMGKIKRSALGGCTFVYFAYNSWILEMFQGCGSGWVHEINK